MLEYIATIALMITGMFLMFIILLQRGRGGGLAGAFGGAGGQSAFGTKAGDVFTKITVVVAVLWVALAGASVFALRGSSSLYKENIKPDPARQGMSNVDGTDAGDEGNADAEGDASDDLEKSTSDTGADAADKNASGDDKPKSEGTDDDGPSLLPKDSSPPDGSNEADPDN